jgi:hypothetical protein
MLFVHNIRLHLSQIREKQHQSYQLVTHASHILHGVDLVTLSMRSASCECETAKEADSRGLEKLVRRSSEPT